ncbi:regulatory protein RecX [Agromyces sp. Marseille-P2726]|uniref:regulatory protein RecX n=1 Tax=Agromyces sp. Marseille-P2726 TaxID=2709132 RepID=UPI001570B99F|nr:RecX family transcriptional regulator [Agromyces sp. Marseille-P2726]
MSDASEHLAPVSYLPWATPGDRGSESPARRRDRDRDRDRFGAARSGGSPRPVPLSTVRADEAVEGHDETGAERDARIDRLVVSRLRRSALSVAEVRAVLTEHGLDEAEIEEWIERYERLGYLDDARLAEQLVYVNGARRGRGSVAILHELTRRGVDAAAARAAVDELDPDIERRNALAAAERRVRQLAGLDRQTAERRLSAFLQRRGYSSGVVREAVRAVLGADDS